MRVEIQTVSQLMSCRADWMDSDTKQQTGRPPSAMEGERSNY